MLTLQIYVEIHIVKFQVLHFAMFYIVRVKARNLQKINKSYSNIGNSFMLGNQQKQKF